jgi:acetaldehyde dehydrogenase (acetylating)
MQLIKSLLNGDFLQRSKEVCGPAKGKLRIGIIGTGKIGTDLLVKVLRSPWMDCVVFTGRNLQSPGMRYAAGLGVNVSERGVSVFFEPQNRCDIVFDATSAANHIEHAKIFAELGILAIDMTPSHIGECCVPALGMDEVLRNKNISMISCGGQSSIPVANVLAQSLSGVKKIEVKSIVSANSIGPGTLANLDEYYRNTKAGLKKYTGLANFDVELLVDDVNLETRMMTSVTAYCDYPSLNDLRVPLEMMLRRIQQYVPGYKLEVDPFFVDGGVRVDLSVEGLGDYLPKYAGNLDIINCAAISVAEHYARSVVAKQVRQPWAEHHGRLQMEF